MLASLIFSLREEAGARDVIAAGNFVDTTSMSDSSTADEAVKENLKVSKIQEAVIRIAGNSQDGIQSIGGFLARLACLLYTSPSPRDRTRSRMPSSA